MLWVLAILYFVLNVQGALETENISSEGYPVETHNVTTKDGYILQLIRIPHGKIKGSCKGVIYVMHGLFTGSNSFTYLGSKYGIAYNLADAGYDVWMPNARGTRLSRRHTYLDPDKDKFAFFDITYEDIALYDLPPTFDYILHLTGKERFHYIGHSQGGSLFMVLNSLTTKYHSKIASAHLLSGIGYEQNFPNVALKLLCQNIDALYTTARLTGNVELYPPVFDILLGNAPVSKTLAVLHKTFRIEVPVEIIRGAATKQVAHYCQNIRDKQFRRYDYGLNNYAKYLSTSIPSYDLTKININVTIHYSIADEVQSEKDVLAMVKDMPNAKARKIPSDSFSHLGYALDENVSEWVTDYIIESLNNSQ